MSEPNDGKSLWAWVTELADGSVSTVGFRIDDMHMPLVNRRRDVIEEARPIARRHRDSTGQRVWLREFTAVVDHGDA